MNIVMSVILVFLTITTTKTLLGMKSNWNLFPSNPKKVLYTYVFWVS